MFPDYLDGAKVIEYTERGCYGIMTDVQNNEVVEKETIYYIAVCQYENSNKFNVCWCNEEYRVLQDWFCDSLEECKRSHKTAGAAWYRK